MANTAIRLPLYTFMLKDGSGAVFLRAGSELFMPIFTSAENASLYQSRGTLDCILVELTNRDDLKAYIESPPSRSRTSTIQFRLMFDPIDSNVGEYIVFERGDLLAALP